MTAASPDFDTLFAALCKEVGFCLHPKGEKRVLEALPNGLDAATRAVVVDARRRRDTRRGRKIPPIAVPIA